MLWYPGSNITVTSYPSTVNTTDIFCAPRVIHPGPHAHSSLGPTGCRAQLAILCLLRAYTNGLSNIQHYRRLALGWPLLIAPDARTLHADVNHYPNATAVSQYWNTYENPFGVPGTCQTGPQICCGVAPDRVQAALIVDPLPVSCYIPDYTQPSSNFMLQARAHASLVLAWAAYEGRHIMSCLTARRAAPCPLLLCEHARSHHSCGTLKICHVYCRYNTSGNMLLQW